MRKIFLILSLVIASNTLFAQSEVLAKFVRFVSTDTTMLSQQNGKVFFNHTSGKLRIMWGGSKYTVWPAVGGSGSSTLASLTDVSLTGLATNDFLKYNGTDWINRTPSQVKSDLAITSGDVSGLDALAYWKINGTTTLTGNVDIDGNTRYFAFSNSASGGISLENTYGGGQSGFGITGSNVTSRMYHSDFDKYGLIGLAKSGDYPFPYMNAGEEGDEFDIDFSLQPFNLRALLTSSYSGFKGLVYGVVPIYTDSTVIDKRFGTANYQPLDSDLTTIAGLTATTDNFLVSVSSAWASRTPTQVKTTLGFTTVGNNVVTSTNPSAITFLRANADNSVDWLSASSFRTSIGAGTGSGDALVANPLSQFASTTSSQLRTVLSDESGTGFAYFQGGDIGTPSAGVATNITGLPISGLTGLGTGVATWLGTPSWTNFSSLITGTSPYLTVANPAYTGILSLGTLGFSDTDIMASFQKSVNSYAQIVMQNTNAGATASIDLVMASDNATASTHYLNLGRNSSVYTGSGSLNGVGYGYLTNTSEDLVIGTTTNHSLRFLTNSSTTDNLSISGSGLFAFVAPVSGNTWTSSFTTTANNQSALNIAGSVLTRATSSDNYSHVIISPTLTTSASSAPSQILTALDLNPTFVDGASSPYRVSLRVKSGGFSLFGGTTPNTGPSSGTPTTSVEIQGGNTTDGSYSLTLYNNSGNQRFSFSNQSTLTFGSNASTPRIDISNDGSNSNNGSSLGLNISSNVNSASNHNLLTLRTVGGDIISNNATAYKGLSIGAFVTYAPTAGSTGGFRAVNLEWVNNQTSTATQVIHGVYVNPTNTSVLGTLKSWEHTSGYIQWNSILTPSQITSNQNDYNPTGWTNGGAPNGASILRINTDASRNITSMAGGTAGRLAIITNTGSNNIVLTDDDGATGTAANRFDNNISLTLAANTSVMAYYDGTSSRWRILSMQSSANVTTSGTYTPSPTNTTNVSASTAYVTGYYRTGTMVTVFGKVDIDATLAASTATELQIDLPIASNLTGDEDLGGTAISDSVASLTARIKGDATTDKASVVFKAISLTNDSYSFEFSYQIK